MGIAGFFKKTVNTERQENVAGSFRQTWEAKLTGIAVAIHPVSPDLVSLEGSAFYNTFKMFAAKTLDIQIGDRIIDGTDTYMVQGVALYDDVGGSANEHMKCTLLKGK